MYPKELLELDLLVGVGVNLRQERGNVILREDVGEPPELLHEPRQVLAGDMAAGVPLQR